MKEIIMTGKTVDEAVESACRELGVGRDEVSCEIIDMPHRKLFSSVPAKVRVTVVEDNFSVKDLLASVDKPEQEPAREDPRDKQRKKGKSSQPREDAPRQPQRAPAPVDPQPQPAAAEPARAEQPKAKPEPRPEEPREPEEEIALDALPEGAAAAYAYLLEVASCLGADNLEYRAAKIRDGVKFIIDGADAALLIGRRGETMDSLQYLCLLVSNRAGEDYCRITLDVADYRNKREHTLEALAQKVARKVIKTRYSQTLEPMNPYERRIVHSTIQNIEGVKSESVGQDPNRRVVVSLTAGGRDGGTRSNNSRGGRGGRGGHKDGGRPKGEFQPREPRRDRPEAPRAEASVDREPRELRLDAEPKVGRIDVPKQEEPRPVERQEAPKPRPVPEDQPKVGRIDAPQRPVAKESPVSESPAPAPAPKKQDDSDRTLYAKIEL